MTGRALELLLEPLMEGAKVEEAGERIGPRHRVLGLQPPPIGDDPEPRDQLLGPGRGDEIVVGADVEGARQERVALPAHHDDRGPTRPEIPQLPNQLELLLGGSVE